MPEPQDPEILNEALALFAPEDEGSALLPEALESWLEMRIGDLLRSAPERLVQTLYRIDVDEKAFLEALHSSGPERQIAGLIIRRLIQKAETRRNWRSS